jgi:transposase
MKGKAIPREIREEILEKVRQGEKVSELTQDYGLGQKTIYTWLAKEGAPGLSRLEIARLKRENEALKLLVGELALEKSKREKNQRSYCHA